MMLIARRCFFFYCVAIRCNNELLRLIAPCQKETTTHAKHHPTEDFRIMKKENRLQTKILLIAIVVCFQLTGCASPRPVLYPNAYLKSVGQTQADQDIAECQEIAEEHVSASNTAKNIAKSTATGAGMGAAGGAVGGAIRAFLTLVKVRVS